MRKSKSKSLPKFKTLAELIGFFDSHDMGDYWDRMNSAKFDINIKTKKHLIAVDKDIIPKLNKVAKSKRIPAEELVNVWLREKLALSKRA
jgi:hypothetical protein